MGYTEGNFGMKTYQIRGSLLAVVIPSQSYAKTSDCKQPFLIQLRRPARRSVDEGRCRDLMVGTPP
jgi:hypothetical protein